MTDAHSDHCAQIVAPNPETNTGGLWISNWRPAKDIDWLKQKGITHVLGVIPLSLHKPLFYETTGVKILYYNTEDNNGFRISIYFEESYLWIDEALSKGNVLVHCGAGISRSATIIIAYLMKKNKWTMDHSLKLIQGARPNANPNLGFRKQLKEFEAKLL